jgi:hypothetical protein
MAAKIEIFDSTKLNLAGYGPIGVYVNIGYEPFPEGYNPLPDSQFESYVPDPGFLKNTGLRTPLFTGGFIGSPLLEDGDYEYLIDSQGYSWLYNTFNYMAVSPFRRDLYPAGITRYSAALYAPPPEGSIQIIVNDKNQPQTFAARNADGSSIDYYFATDINGNKFILGSIDAVYAEDPSAPFWDAVLPAGWSKSVEILDTDLTIYPSYSNGNRRFYNQFRDNLTNNYFQFAFAPNGKGIAREVPGFALVGGNEDDRIIGTSLSEDLYGARGGDNLIAGGGNDRIWGDDGNDTLTGGAGSDLLTGGAGSDTFRFALTDSLLASFDRIVDFAIGTDRIDGPNKVSAANLRDHGTVSALTQAGIATVLTESNFLRNGAATFTFLDGATTRTFLALNNNNPGFSATTDSIIEITGYTGLLTNLADDMISSINLVVSSSSVTEYGTAQVGQVLTVAKTAEDLDDNVTFAYQWQSSTDGSTWGNIGSNAASYTLSAAERGKQVRVRVSYADVQHFSESLTVAVGAVPVYDAQALTYISSTNQAMSARLTTTSGNFDGEAALKRLGTAPGYVEQNANLSIGKTGINFTLNLDPASNSKKAKLSVDLAPLLDGVTTTQKRLAYFVYSNPVGLAAPMATAFTYDPVLKAGARFFDLDGNGSADTADLQFVDGGYGDKDGVENGVVVDPSTAGAVDLSAIFTATANSLTVGDLTDTSSPASLLVRASLSSRSSTVNQIGYVAFHATESLSLSYDLVKERGTLLFGTLQNNDVPDTTKMSFQRDINLINGQKLMFFEVVDNTLEAMLKSGRLDSSFRTLDVTKLTDSSATAGKGGSILSLFLSNDVSGLGELISSQMGDAPVFDFSSLSGQTLTGDVLIAREASYDSTIGFYKLERSDGAVRDSLTNSLVLPGEAGYAAAALRSTNLFSGFGSLATSNRTNKTADLAAFKDAGLLAPFARVANTGETYFSFAAANSDGLSHFRVLGSGVLGLEDIKGGGDRDFDDLIVAFNFRLGTGTLA